MTEAEKKLLEASVNTSPHHMPDLWPLRRAVWAERLETEIPNWRAQMVEIAVPFYRMTRKYRVLRERIEDAGLWTRELENEIEERAK